MDLRLFVSAGFRSDSGFSDFSWFCWNATWARADLLERARVCVCSRGVFKKLNLTSVCVRSYEGRSECACVCVCVCVCARARARVCFGIVVFVNVECVREALIAVVFAWGWVCVCVREREIIFMLREGGINGENTVKIRWTEINSV